MQQEYTPYGPEWAKEVKKLTKDQIINDFLRPALLKAKAEPGGQSAGTLASGNYEKEWEDFWKEIVCNPDGSINVEQVKKELSDFSFVIEQVPKVYCHITDSLLSKIMYTADTVIRVADDRYNKMLQEELKEAAKDKSALPDNKDREMALLKWITEQEAEGKINLCGGNWYWEVDWEGDHPLSCERIHTLWLQSLTNKP